MMRANTASDSWITVPAIRNLDIFVPVDFSEREMSVLSPQVDSPDQFALIAESLRSQQRRTVSEAPGNHFVEPLYRTIYPENDMNQGHDPSQRSSGPTSGQGRDTLSSSSSGVRRALEVQERKYDAQDVYPTKACLFVGNLLLTATDRELQIALRQVFAKWGTPYIKIKRPAEPGKSPVAFAQFQRIEESEKAKTEANGIPVFGRRIRIERANSKLFWFVYRKDGAFITVDDVSMVVRGLGKSTVDVAPGKLAQSLGHGFGIRVRFEQWDQGRDLSRTFQHPFGAQHYDEAALERQAQFPGGRKNGDAGGAPFQMPNSNAGVQRIHQNRRSVYCGNLPREVTEEEIRGLFDSVEIHVQSIRIVRKERGAYAFVQLPHPEMCSQACSALNGTRLRGLDVKVELRKSVGGQPRENVSGQSVPSGNLHQRAASAIVPPHLQRANGAVSGPVQPTPPQPEPVNTLPAIEPQPDRVPSTQLDIDAHNSVQGRLLWKLIALRNGSEASTYSPQYSLGNHVSGTPQQLVQAPRPTLHISGPPMHGNDVNHGLAHLAVSAAQGAAAASMLHGFPNVGSPTSLGHQVQHHFPAPQLPYFVNASGDVFVRVPGTLNEARPTQQ